MSKVKSALRKVERIELAGLGAGLPSEASKTRAERSLTLVAARRVLDHLQSTEAQAPTTEEIDEETGRRLVVSVPRHRTAEAVIPEGFEGADTPARTLNLYETRARIYRPLPFGLHGAFPLAVTHRVTMSETAGDPEDRITLTGSNKIGFYESPDDLEKIVTFNHNLELIARAMGFDRQLAVTDEGLFLPDDYASMRAH